MNYRKELLATINFFLIYNDLLCFRVSRTPFFYVQQVCLKSSEIERKIVKSTVHRCNESSEIMLSLILGVVIDSEAVISKN